MVILISFVLSLLCFVEPVDPVDATDDWEDVLTLCVSFSFLIRASTSHSVLLSLATCLSVIPLLGLTDICLGGGGIGGFICGAIFRG